MGCRVRTMPIPVRVLASIIAVITGILLGSALNGLPT